MGGSESTEPGIEKRIVVDPSYDSLYAGKSEVTCIFSYPSQRRSPRISASGSRHILALRVISTFRPYDAITSRIFASSAFRVDSETLFFSASRRSAGVMLASFSLASFAVIIEKKLGVSTGTVIENKIFTEELHLIVLF